MCDKNCSGGTEVCACRCQQVTAYKSKNGSIYETHEKCRQANEAFDKAEERKRKAKIDNKATDAIYKVANYNGHFRISGYEYGGYRNEYREGVERGYASALSDICNSWRELRSMLNAIQD